MAFNFFLRFGTTAYVLPLSRTHPGYFNNPLRSGFAEPLLLFRLHHSNLYHGKHIVCFLHCRVFSVYDSKQYIGVTLLAILVSEVFLCIESLVAVVWSCGAQSL